MKKHVALFICSMIFALLMLQRPGTAFSEELISGGAESIEADPDGLEDLYQGLTDLQDGDDFLYDENLLESGEETSSAEDLLSEADEGSDTEDGEALQVGGPVAGGADPGQGTGGIASVGSIDPSAIRTNCKIYSGSNVEYQNYINWSSPIRSYLYDRSDGQIMRLQYGAVSGALLVEYYDQDYNFLGDAVLTLDLPIFGGFYEGTDAYYVLTGQSNTEESDEKAVICITKYSKNWVKQGAAALYGCNTTYPFDAGCPRMDMYGKYLLIRTSHEMYTSSDGYNHQANLNIQVDTSTMTITDASYNVFNNGYDYVSHSFNQFVRIDGNRMVGVDHGDAYPRAITIVRDNTDLSTGKFFGSVNRYTVMSFQGEIGDNYTGASVGGFEISDSSYLVAGVCDASYGSYSKRNVFVGVVPRNAASGTAATIKWYTDYAGEETGASTPQLVKTGANSFFLLWSHDAKVYYTRLDGTGSRVGDIYSLNGNLSDCVPAVINGKLTWYTWKNETLIFYTIPVSDPASHEAVMIVNGHKYAFGAPVNGEITGTCRICGEKKTFAVPTSVSFWKQINGTGRWSGFSADYIEMNAGTSVDLEADPSYTSSLNDRLSEFEFVISDGNIVSVTESGWGDLNRILTALKQGVVTLTVRAKYNPSVQKIFTIYVDTLNPDAVYLDGTQYTYTGSSIAPGVTVYFGTGKLTEGTDYKVEYQNNVNAGTAKAVVTGIGKYTGTVTKEFRIVTKTLSYTFAEDIPDQTYTGKALTPAPVLKYNGMTLKAGTDYTLAYSSNVNYGYATVTVTGKGNYAGTLSLQFYIQRRAIDKSFIQAIPDQIFTGSSIIPTPVLKWNGMTLVSRTDYNTTYSNNLYPGTATATVQGSGNYTGSVSVTFKILPRSLTEATIAAIGDETYTGTALTPVPKVTWNGRTLGKGTDFTVSYANNINAGTATVTITGTGNYTDTVTRTFKILPRNVSECGWSNPADQIYSGSALQPAVALNFNGMTLVSGKDYKLSYGENINAGTGSVTATGIGNYTGTAVRNFKISAKLLEDTFAAAIPDQTYTGSAIVPVPVLKWNGMTLVNGTDYSVTYTNNVNTGTATATITGKGNYRGSLTRTFRILRKSISADFVRAIADEVYNRNAHEPALTVTWNGNTLVKGTDYTAVYQDNVNAGTASVTITGTGNYQGAASITFKILPKPLEDGFVSAIADQTYTGSPVTPDPALSWNGISLQKGTEYTVSYEQNIKVGTATAVFTGKGNYTSTVRRSFRIVHCSISTAVVSDIPGMPYTGSAITPQIVVSANGTALTEGVDFTVTFQNNVNVGTGLAIINGIGGYNGTTQATFVIMGKPVITFVYNSVKGGDIRWKEEPNATGYVVYCQRSAEGIRKVATINDPGVTQCYDPVIRTGCWGRVYHYYITALYGTKEGPKSDKLVLQRLAPMKITGLKNTAAGRVTCTYACTVNENKALGYEIQYAQSKQDLFDRKGTFKKVSVTGRKNLSKVITGLTKGKTYFFRVRCYVDYEHSITHQKTKTWSQYSDVVSVKIGK